MERETGFEPATATLARWSSTTELLPLNQPICCRLRVTAASNRSPNLGKPPGVVNAQSQLHRPVVVLPHARGFPSGSAAGRAGRAEFP